MFVSPVLKSAVANITAVAGTGAAALYAAASTLPVSIPPSLIPSGSTAFEGMLAAILVLIMKTIPTKKENMEIASNLAIHVASQAERFNALDTKLSNHIEEESDAESKREEMSMRLSGWMGGVTETLKHHGELIAKVGDSLDMIKERRSEARPS
jgi:hypothetical protein